MSKERNESKRSEIEIRIARANRLHMIGELFLEMDPEANRTGIADHVSHLSITDDAKLPELLNPKDEYEIELAKENAKTNARAEAMPTSIDNTTVYSIRRGEAAGEIRFIVHTRRVDLGYKIPEISFNTGDVETDREMAADFLAEMFASCRSRTEDEKKHDEWEQAIESTLLSDNVVEILLSPELLKTNQVEIVERDNMTGLAAISTVKLDSQDETDGKMIDDLFYLEFNLLSDLRQKGFDAKPEYVERIKGLVDDYCRK